MKASPPDRGRPAPSEAPRGGPHSARLLRRAIINPDDESLREQGS
jgi:hypothetical protein